ncbi:hypothetical protein R0131_14070 [Clostridium sp. AL.422]|uniref:hypothetical protein n=1 Tax=Clostridium TaxID=1485 RepID=UPI00293DFC97|nr:MULTISPECIES: hypothetical protein [unclassified Clostridium]MDV4151950.1 hypothetical protein [Clostridium sp. AL.422]
MFISIPKDFFVPVLFNDEFRYNSESNAMEYDTGHNNAKANINRQKLQDIEYAREETGFTEESLENLINIDDEKIQEQILNYSKSFLKLIEELKNANCLDSNTVDVNKLINNYAKGLRDLYYEYKNLIIEVRLPISQSDEEGIIDEFIGRLEDMYNKNLEELNCKNLNYDVIEGTMDQLFDDARDILREEISNINCELVNRKSTCKSAEEIQSSVNNTEAIYNKIDEEFIMELGKSSK